MTRNLHRHILAAPDPSNRLERRHSPLGQPLLLEYLHQTFEVMLLLYSLSSWHGVESSTTRHRSQAKALFVRILNEVKQVRKLALDLVDEAAKVVVVEEVVFYLCLELAVVQLHDKFVTLT